MKELLGIFSKEKGLVGAFYVIVKTPRKFVYSSSRHTAARIPDTDILMPAAD